MLDVRPRILCVDDDLNLLGAIRRQLSKKFDAQTALGGGAALEMLAPHGPYEVVVSDMRMPRMNGTEFLAAMRTRSPDTTRILLTAYSEMDVAIAAVNDGQIFRFLCKPCSPTTLTSAVDAGVEQYRLRRAEQDLLKQTLRGSVDALCDVLALASPLAFGRAQRIQRTAVILANAVEVANVWLVEVATLLSQLGAVTLPEDVLERWGHGQALSTDEEAMVAQFPAIAESLLGRIPRLEHVREIIRQAPRAYAPAQPSPTSMESRILRLSVDLDAMQIQGMSMHAALQILGTREGYDPVLLASARQHLTDEAPTAKEHFVALHLLKLGMVLDQDLRDEQQGMLLVARGYTVSESLLIRLHNLGTRPGLPEFIRICRQ